MRASGAAGGGALLNVGLDPSSRHAPGSDPYAASDLRLVGTIKRCLEFHYPGHDWEARVEHETGLCYIGLPGIFWNWRYRVNLRAVIANNDIRPIIRGAGELLERIGMPRSGFSAAHYAEAKRKFPIFLARNWRNGPPGGR